MNFPSKFFIENFIWNFFPSMNFEMLKRDWHRAEILNYVIKDTSNKAILTTENSAISFDLL